MLHCPRLRWHQSFDNCSVDGTGNDDGEEVRACGKKRQPEAHLSQHPNRNRIFIFSRNLSGQWYQLVAPVV